jgi:hypothetical protein
MERWTGFIVEFLVLSDEARKRHEESRTRFGSGPDRFSTISFAKARFNGEADFSGRRSNRTLILAMHVFTTRQFSNRRPVSLAYILVLAVPKVSTGLPTPKSWFACATFEKSPKKRGAAIPR